MSSRTKLATSTSPQTKVPHVGSSSGTVVFLGVVVLLGACTGAIRRPPFAVRSRELASMFSSSPSIGITRVELATSIGEPVIGQGAPGAPQGRSFASEGVRATCLSADETGFIGCHQAIEFAWRHRNALFLEASSMDALLVTYSVLPDNKTVTAWHVTWHRVPIVLHGGIASGCIASDVYAVLNASTGQVIIDGDTGSRYGIPCTAFGHSPSGSAAGSTLAAPLRWRTRSGHPFSHPGLGDDHRQGVLHRVRWDRRHLLVLVARRAVFAHGPKSQLQPGTRRVLCAFRGTRAVGARRQREHSLPGEMMATCSTGLDPVRSS